MGVHWSIRWGVGSVGAVDVCAELSIFVVILCFEVVANMISDVFQVIMIEMGGGEGGLTERCGRFRGEAESFCFFLVIIAFFEDHSHAGGRFG